jgi:hypothetical protein
MSLVQNRLHGVTTQTMSEWLEPGAGGQHRLCDSSAPVINAPQARPSLACVKRPHSLRQRFGQ